MLIHAIIMFFGMVALHVFVMPFAMATVPSDAYFSLSQGYMGIFMGAAMLAIDGILHPVEWWYWVAVIAIATLSIAAFRGQWLVSDREYLHEMVPHHSMALLTSRSRMESQNPKVSRLAHQIVMTQEREIAEMKEMLLA
jgi:hypothetical protein